VDGSRPTFDRPILPGGYQWFYLDGVSDDGAHGIVVIALLGNPFSPAYARACAVERAPDPLGFAAMHVALYGRGARWALTERRIDARGRGADGVAIGPSTMRWEGGRLVVDLDEVAPWTRAKVRGLVTFAPDDVTRASFALDAHGKHRWWPIAPRGTLEVRLAEPRVSFRACGYYDANAGDEPLAAAFRGWTWSRAHAADGRTWVTYDVQAKRGAEEARALAIRGSAIDAMEAPPSRALGRTRWGLAREARVEGGFRPRIVATLEDGPFYARSIVETRLGGAPVRAVHETLSCERLERRAVRFLLGFRMREGRC
jgi:carotenoid 1,2-hydratase